MTRRLFILLTLFCCFATAEAKEKNDTAFQKLYQHYFQLYGEPDKEKEFFEASEQMKAYYLKKGILKAPLHFQMCMGCANGIPGSTKNLVFMVETMNQLCPGSTWSAFGVGHSAMEIMYATVALGGHIRVGMEDNVMYAKGVLADSNRQFVERAARVIREKAILPPQIGIATDSTLFMPESESAADIEAARAKTFAGKLNHYYLNWWLDPIQKGEAHPRLREMLSDAELALIHQPLDFLGWNCYLASNYNDGPDGKPWPGMPRTNMGWAVTPDALYWGVRFIHERYRLPIIISENGVAIIDFKMDDGRVHDPQRIQFMKWYLRGLKRAADEGYPVKGYMAWSILDNLEWAHGFDRRFGLIYVDFRTQERTLKDSAYWYAELIRTNGESL